MEEDQDEEYCEKMQVIIKHDFHIMMKILKNIDLEKKDINVETVPSLLLIKNTFISSIIKNIEAVYAFKALQNVIDKKELEFIEKELGLSEKVGASSLENFSTANLYM